MHRLGQVRESSGRGAEGRGDRGVAGDVRADSDKQTGESCGGLRVGGEEGGGGGARVRGCVVVGVLCRMGQDKAGLGRAGRAGGSGHHY